MSDKIYNVLFPIFTVFDGAAGRYLTNRISLFLTLPHSILDEVTMKQKLREIGKVKGANSGASA